MQLPPPVIDPDVDLSEPQRQSLWAVVLLGLRTLRQIGVFQLVILVGFVVARVPSVTLLFGLAVLVALVLFVIATVQWWRYTFYIADGELVVRRGVLQQQRLTIPLARVQSVSLEQKLLHRVVSTVQVELDTAGTDSAEFVIEALDRPVAHALQRAVADHRPDQRVHESEGVLNQVFGDGGDEVLIKHSSSRIVRMALTQTPFAGLILIGPLIALADDLDSVLERVGLDLPSFDGGPPEPGLWLLWFIPLLLIAGFALGVLLNVVRVALSDWNLTVTSTAAGLRRDAGLLSTSSIATTLSRVQILRTSQGLLERLAALRTIDLRIIGSTSFTVQGTTDDQVGLLHRIVMPGAAVEPVLDQMVSTAETFKNTRNALVLFGLAAIGLWFGVGWWSVLLLVGVPVVWATSRRSVRLRRWGLTGEVLSSHAELLGWTRNEMLLRKINGVVLRQTLFERKRDLASVVFASAAGTITIGMIPLIEARRIRDWGLYHVETDTRSWM